MITKEITDNKLKITILAERNLVSLIGELFFVVIIGGVLLVPGFMIVIEGEHIFLGIAFLAFWGLITIGGFWEEVYPAMVRYFNKSIVEVDLTILTISAGPLPWPRQKQFELIDLRQLYVRPGHKSKSEIWAITKDRKHLKLLANLPSSDEATEATQEIETFLSDHAPAEVRLTTYTQTESDLILKGITTESQADTFVITCRWQARRSLSVEDIFAFIMGGFVAVGGMLFLQLWALLIIEIFWQGGSWVGVIVGTGLLMLPEGAALVIGFLIYKPLVRYFNTSIIRINPQTLDIRHGPLPYRRNQRFKREDISQLYVKKQQHKRKGGVDYSYKLYLIIRQNKQHCLLETLEAEQVMYLEKKIEQILNLKDQSIPDEYGVSSLPDQEKSFASWKQAAEAHRLDFVDLVNKVQITGVYRGHKLDLEPIFGEGGQPYTRLTIFSHVKPARLAKEGEPLDRAEVERLLATSGSGFELSGAVKTWQKGYRLVYEQKEIEPDPAYLHFLFDKCCDLLDVGPHLATGGGEIAPALLAIANHKGHPMELIAVRVLQEIAQDTTARLSRQISSLVCPTCLARFGPLEISIQTLAEPLYYYGCRICGQSRQNLVIEGKIVAVLDNVSAKRPEGDASRRGPEIVVEGVDLRVNWLLRRVLFDFDEVEIIQATDEEVERLAVLVGNNTDPAQKPRYREMRCVISPECKLSENTLRVLRRTFGRVEGRCQD